MSAQLKPNEQAMRDFDMQRRRGAVHDIERAKDGVESLKDELQQTVDFHYPALRDAFVTGDTLEMGRILERTWFEIGDRCWRANLHRERMQDQGA
jgi:hypothetical protein